MKSDNFFIPDIPDDLIKNINIQNENVSSKKPENVLSDEQFITSLLSHHDFSEWAKTFVNNINSKYSKNDVVNIFKENFFDEENKINIPYYMKRENPPANWLVNFIQNINIDSSVSQNWLSKGFLKNDPEWLYKLLHLEKAQVARIFLLTGNINDYAFDPLEGYRPTIRLLIDNLKKTKDCVLSFSLSQGLKIHSCENVVPEDIKGNYVNRNFNTQESLLSNVCSLFDSLRKWLETENNLPKGVAVIFENINMIIPSNADIERNFLVDSLLNWSTSPSLFRSPHCMILTAESLDSISNDLVSQGGKFEQINITRPISPDTRLKFLLAILQPLSGLIETRFAHQKDGISISGYEGTYVTQLEKISHDTAGLTLIGIEDILQQISLKNEPLGRDTILNGKRDRLIQESNGLLEVISPNKKLEDVGGYDKLKDRIKEIIYSLKNASNPIVNITIPMGIMFLGPPGTGKTITAEAIAKESEISMAKLGDFRGMYVGESERNLSRIFSLIEALHPVIIFMDEIDQSEGTRGDSSDSGVSKRVFGKLLQFMSDTSHRGKILWIAASNRPDKIDAAMKRPGRFDLALPFLLPDTLSRQQIFKIILENKTKNVSGIKTTLSDDNYKTLAEKTDKFSGAEIEAIVSEVIRRISKECFDETSEVEINQEIFDTVLGSYLPSIKKEHYTEMEDLALMEVSFLDLLPEEYKKRRLKLQEQNL